MDAGMTEATNVLVDELPGRTRADIPLLGNGIGEFISARAAMVSRQAGAHSIHGIRARHGSRLDRIGTRLEMRELAEAQERYRFDE
ncbi:MAG: hypothetical protein CMJ42_02165 [Phyllobacteriaceae bacterium]|nr:hypothetical protein [Phyllobacteriaceae bacterium]MBA90360.1 hypothetical protein [Phyllobacteriaceae bacterium]